MAPTTSPAVSRALGEDARGREEGRTAGVPSEVPPGQATPPVPRQLPSVAAALVSGSAARDSSARWWELAE